jgi:hypothetical protein
MGIALSASSSERFEPSARDTVRLSARLQVVVLLGLSALLKVGLAVENYWNGYRAGDFRGVGIDGWGYVERAVGRVETLGEANWLWDAANVAVLRALGDETYLYLVMSLINVGLSLLLPFALLPALRRLVPPGRRDVAALLVIGVLLFWPPAVWLAGQNLKDTLLTVCVAAYVSANAVALDATATTPQRFLAVVCAAASAWLVSALRIYAVAILLVGSLVAFLALPGRRLPRAALIGLAGILAFVSPPGQQMFSMIKFGVSLITDSAFREIVNSDLLLINNAPLALNLSPATFVLGAVRAPLNPYPGPNVTTWYDVAMMARTVVVCMVLPGFLVALAKWRHPQRPFYLATLAAAWLFFAVQASLNGARQVYSTIEPPFVMLAVALFVLHPRARAWRYGMVMGAGLALVLFAYTAVRTAMGA